MVDREPRHSTDSEAAPLLRDPEAEDTYSEQQDASFFDKLNAIAQEPLTPLTKILLVVALVLLLLTSIFIGLFAGVQHKLNVERGQPPTTTATTATLTFISTETVTTTTPITLPPPTPTSEPPEPVCLTPQCIRLSASILSSIDVSQDPCESFYEFANGGWLRAHPVPADKGSYGNFEALQQQNTRIIQNILESNDSTPSISSQYDEILLQRLRDFYSSCLNEDLLDEIGAEPLVQFVQNLREIYRENTTIISADKEAAKSKGLTAALAFLHSRGVDALFTFDIEGDVGQDPNHLSLWFSQPSLGLPSKEYYSEKSITKVYRNVLEKLLLTLAEEQEELSRKAAVKALTVNAESVWPPWPWPPWGEDPGDDEGDEPVDQEKRAHELAKKVLKFETKIANASLDLDILQEDPVGTYNPVPLSNLTSTLPQIHFPEYFAAFTTRSFPSQVILTYPAYAESLSKILDETDADVLEAYLVLRAALTLSPYLGTSTDAWKAQRELYELLTGVKKGVVGDRAEYCVGVVERHLGFASGRFFVNETFGGSSKERGTRVITDIVSAFKASLKHLEWMDEVSAEAAQEKADSIRVKVGYPLYPNTTNPRSIVSYYSGLKVQSGSFFQNILSSATTDSFRTWLTLGRQRNPDSWEMYASTVNAYFNPPANEIVFPAGILQPPFFSKDWPAYMIYGAFGQVAAHELTHAFDSAGRMYNQEGKLEEWWTAFTTEGFQRKQDCIVEQYSNYTIDDGKGGKIPVNGNLTSGENIGDTGLIQAYRAWRSQYYDSLRAGDEYVLPGLNFTKEQLFFVAFGQIWARSMKPATAVQRIRTDPHSPTKYRVDGTLFNIPEFAKAFNCSATAKLNPPPEKQCRFW